ncbi:hypothetical protein [Flavimarina sp. Hel_I_48]|uniref:hypothetical protein n=1 Tax=Flavimarina sp. Hel_I_48 TaxID=1392488 RepID=UPI0004DF27EC|nr:hypothetical protein [Flavimarina sp. Hel_I_48]
MRTILLKLLVFGAVILTSCDSQDDELPQINLQAADLNFTVIQDPQRDNDLSMTSNDKSMIPYWSYTDASGNELGHSNKSNFSITLPFAGSYFVNYIVYTQGGAVEATPVKVDVSENDEEFFSAEEWQMLTNGVEGKTWVLNMVNPIGYAGLDFPYGPENGDYWNWYPDYVGNEWLLEQKDWGEMTFDLDGGYNVSVIQTALNSSEQKTTSGSFGYAIEDHAISFNGGVELLYGGDYYADVSNWKSVNVIELTENSMRLAVIRDQSRSGEGPAQIVFHFKPKDQ